LDRLDLLTTLVGKLTNQESQESVAYKNARSIRDLQAGKARLTFLGSRDQMREKVGPILKQFGVWGCKFIEHDGEKVTLEMHTDPKRFSGGKFIDSLRALGFEFQIGGADWFVDNEPVDIKK
jgi:hypothetical protein